MLKEIPSPCSKCGAKLTMISHTLVGVRSNGLGTSELVEREVWVCPNRTGFLGLTRSGHDEVTISNEGGETVISKN